jgi:hypothetical protein
VKKNMKNSAKKTWTPGRDLQLEPAIYKAGVLSTLSQRLAVVKDLNVAYNPMIINIHKFSTKVL